MKNTIWVSVIIPTHNRADILRRAINSILNQSFKNYEIVIISDGSTDNTEEIINTISKNDSRINFFHYYPPKGANYARNLGIKNSKYEYIAFLDDDDEWYPDKLQKQMNIFNMEKGIGMVCGGMHFFYVDQKSNSFYIPSPPNDCSKKILIHNIIGGTPSVIIRKDILNDAGLFDENLMALQDYDLWIRICQLRSA